MKRFHRLILYTLYTVSLIVTVYLAVSGWYFYRLEYQARPHHPMYEAWKPSGSIGHTLGVIGSVFLVSLLAYVLRKRFRPMHSWGNIKHWLNFHIWMGITGPILIMYHSAFKFHGIVAYSFWSMVAVALSGILGRYLYIQIPRTRSGVLIGKMDLEKQDHEYWMQLQQIKGLNEETVNSIRDYIDKLGRIRKKSWAVLPEYILQDILRPYRMLKLRKTVISTANLTRKERRPVLKLILKQELLARRMAFLDAAHFMLHYWHIIHRPFAATMYLFMIVHIIVAILFGYTWIF